MIFWLKNRQSDKWRDKKALEHSGPDNKPLVEELSTMEAAKRILFVLAKAEHEATGARDSTMTCYIQKGALLSGQAAPWPF